MDKNHFKLNLFILMLFLSLPISVWAEGTYDPNAIVKQINNPSSYCYNSSSSSSSSAPLKSCNDMAFEDAYISAQEHGKKSTIKLLNVFPDMDKWITENIPLKKSNPNYDKYIKPTLAKINEYYQIKNYDSMMKEIDTFGEGIKKFTTKKKKSEKKDALIVLSNFFIDLQNKYYTNKTSKHQQYVGALLDQLLPQNKTTFNVNEIENLSRQNDNPLNVCVQQMMPQKSFDKLTNVILGEVSKIKTPPCNYFMVSSPPLSEENTPALLLIPPTTLKEYNSIGGKIVENILKTVPPSAYEIFKKMPSFDGKNYKLGQEQCDQIALLGGTMRFPQDYFQYILTIIEKSLSSLPDEFIPLLATIRNKINSNLGRNNSKVVGADTTEVTDYGQKQVASIIFLRRILNDISVQQAANQKLPSNHPQRKFINDLNTIVNNIAGVSSEYKTIPRNNKADVLYKTYGTDVKSLNEIKIQLNALLDRLSSLSRK